MAASAGAWYRVGTVSVTNGSAAIVGVGSNWQNDVIAIAIGDAFTIDAKTWYEVISVNDDTSITLDRGFEGATASDVEYAILRNTSGTILTRIAGQIAVQFNQKQLFLDELRNWLTSEDETATLTDSHGIAHVVKTVNKIQELTGTAADKDIVTSTTDTTAGRLLTVGYGGWGSENAGPSVGVDFGDVRLPMMVIPVEISESTGDLPESSGFGTLLPIPGVQNSTSHQWYFSRSSSELNKILFRTKRSTATPYEDWVEMYHSGNSVNPLDYGLGSAGALSLSDSNINDAPVVNTFLGWSSGSNPAANAPLSSGMSGVRVSSGVTRHSDLLISTQGVNSTNPARAFIKSWDGISTYGWQELYTSGNSVNPLNYGIGGDVPFLADLDDTTVKSGRYRIDSKTLNSVINGALVTGFVEVMTRATGARISYKVVSEGGDGRIFSRVYNSGLAGTGFSPWFQTYHSGNTNFNEFTFNQNDVKSAYVRVTGQLFVDLPINSFSAPTGITVTGTFSVINITTGATVSSGLTPVINSVSSNKNLVVYFIGTFDRAANYIVYADNGGATIEVNF